MDKKSVLGRGLASLIPDARGNAPTKRQYFECDIEKIVPNTYQPRKLFDKAALQELVDSIKANGIIQPLIVRIRDGHYELIAGERRWRAAQKAGLTKVPVVVKEVDQDVHSLEMALIENIQRQELNCIEEAIAYQQLVDQFQLSHEEIATRVGKSRATVANTIRLLKLPAVIREDISAGKLTMGHARSLLALEQTEDQLAVREEILRDKLSVRDTEKRVNERLKAKADPGAAEKAAAERDVHIQALEDRIRRHFGTKAKIVGNAKKGFIQVVYSSQEDLNRISELLLGKDA
ncbi:MAG: ParB/RepB/Spo0J family partition protein [Bdellovibrionaceae bacterium]|nr:ParB/RepB/Spo0J family partition protein [Pseudobdellovibrionaceae bacterium]